MTTMTSTIPASIFDDITLETLSQRNGGKWLRYGRDVISACTIELDFPSSEPVQQRIIEMVTSGQTGYPDFPGPPVQLFEAWSNFSGRHFGWASDPAMSFCTDYVSNGLTESLKALLEPGTRVGYTTPGFMYLTAVIERAGMVPTTIAAIDPTDGANFMDLEIIEDAFRAGITAFILVNPYHPHGFVPSVEHLTAFAALADRYGVRIFSDEIYSPSTFPGVTFTPFGSLDAESARRSVTAVGAAKTWNLRSFPTAMLYTGDQATADALNTPGMKRSTASASYVGTEAMVTALNESDAWLDALTSYLEGNARIVENEFPALLPGAIISKADSGFAVWIDLNALGIDEPTAYFIEKGKVGISRGQAFGPQGFRCLRLNTGTPAHVIREIGKRMASAI
ncbi:MAG: cystathionine beta-lyase [Microbacteriaceae bacterium]|nr:cystathionine beta-lyase [Microbacteriaceae bacterium]